ncbi:SRPBCC domain-containing protein [Corynebacterium lubricantis]|uniref:SRPBCC domain-containing protein n=1 Tax=Corynebacterium lubricantis TaxID=541095 RepID=UPI0003664CEA|nr:SRPBCC domain-containing protein [Corynebacterium lubricantis]
MDTTHEYDNGKLSLTGLAHAPQQVVWETLTSPSAIGKWWEHPAHFPNGMTAGSEGTFEWVGHGFFPIRIMRNDAPNHFDFLWGELHATHTDENASLVQFSLRDVDGNTEISVSESGFERLDEEARKQTIEENTQGWEQVLSQLAAMSELA